MNEEEEAHNVAIKDILEEDDFVWDESFLEDEIIIEHLEELIKEKPDEVN